jgi:hypothetical protein
VRGVGSEIVAGRRIRFPDHEYVAGPWTVDELWVHLSDVHGDGTAGFNAERQASAHFAAHEGFEVVRLYVRAHRSRVENYLGFGALVVGADHHQDGTDTTIVDIPPEHSQWLVDRLASGLIRTDREEIQA